MKTKEERDLVLYGVYDRLLTLHSKALKGTCDNAPRKALVATYDDIALLFDLTPSTIRHIISRMQGLHNGVGVRARVAAENAAREKIAVLQTLIA